MVDDRKQWAATGAVDSDMVRGPRRAMAFVLLLVLWMVGGSALALDPQGLAVPAHLGEVTERVGGEASRPAVLIVGESHVNLDVQRNVAELVGYLRAFYGVELLLVEGHNGALTVSADEGLPLRVRRAIARTELEGRQIGAADYVAMAYPDVEVIGVEDMAAYQAHDEQMGGHSKAVENRTEVLNAEFEDFLENELGELSATEGQFNRLQAAMLGMMADGGIDPFADVVYEIAGRNSPTGQRMQRIVEQLADLKEFAGQSPADMDGMAQRDDGMVGNVQRVLDEQQRDAVLIVGAMHQTGIAERLRVAGIPYAVIEVSGLQQSIDGAGEDDAEVYEAWKAGKGGGLEQLLSRFKPQPPLQRDSYQDAVAVKNALYAIDLAVAEGGTVPEIEAMIPKLGLPPTTRIDQVRKIPGGTEFRLINGDQVIEARFGPTADAVRKTGKAPVEIGKAPGGRHFAFYGGGGGMDKPPSGPRAGGPAGPSGPAGPGGAGGGPSRGSGGKPRILALADRPRSDNEPVRVVLGDLYDPYERMLEQRDQSNPNTLVVLLLEQNGRLYWIVNNELRLIDADPDRLAELARRLRAAETLPEYVDLARQLGERLLDGMDDLTPEDAERVWVAIGPEPLRGLALTELAGYGRVDTARRFAQLPEVAMDMDRLADTTAEELVSWQEPAADPARIAVLVDDRLRDRPAYAALREKLADSAFQLNAIDAETQTVIVVGDTAADGLEITLRDGTEFDPGSEVAQRALEQVEQIIAFDAEPSALQTSARWTKQETLGDADTALTNVDEIVDAVSTAKRKGTGERLSELRKKQSTSARRQTMKALTAGLASSEKWFKAPSVSPPVAE